MELTGASIVIKTLVEQGVDTIFGYPGGAVLPFYDELYKQTEIRHILVRHEQAAVHAAEAYARSTGKVGVILVTSGPGATNTITGLTDALLDSVPLVCLTGQVPTNLIGRDAFQEADTVGITQSCTKHNYLVKDAKNVANTVREAFHIASTGRPGPVVIDLPKNVQLAKVEFTPNAPMTRKSYKVVKEPTEQSVENAINLIASAKRPLFYTGGGIINSGTRACELLTELVKLSGFPITNTLMGLGAFPGSDDQFIGMLGMHGTYEANLAMAECDVMINIGARFDDRITGATDKFSLGSKKIHVDIDASSINKNILVDVPVVGDAESVLERMLALWKEKNVTPDAAALKDWWSTIEKWREVDCLSYDQSGDLIKPQWVLDTINKRKDPEAFITTDVGQHQMWSAQYFTFDKPYKWMTSGGLGTMGYGLPAAVGTQIANPDGQVICISGEASIMMNIQELATVAQYKLPVKLMILHNSFMGMVRQWQEMFHEERYSESNMDHSPDFIALANAFGIEAIRCDRKEDVEATIDRFLAAKGPIVVDMAIDPEENVFPMIPAGAPHYEMKLSPAHQAIADKLKQG
jgi:acetolactate synthase-1/2/3 large subunit